MSSWDGLSDAPTKNADVATPLFPRNSPRRLTDDLAVRDCPDCNFSCLPNSVVQAAGSTSPLIHTLIVAMTLGKATAIQFLSPNSQVRPRRVCVPFVGRGFAHHTRRNPTTKGTKYTKNQGVVMENVSGSGVSHPFCEAVGCLSLVILFVCFVTFVVPLRGFGCSAPEHRRWGRTHAHDAAGGVWVTQAQVRCMLKVL